MNATIQSPKSPEIDKAIALQKAGHIQEALNHYQALLTKTARKGPLHQLMGICYAQQQQWQKSISAFEKACTSEPENPHYLSSLANAQRKHNPREAIRLFTEVLEIQPKQLSALNNLGILYYEAGDFENAIPLFLKATHLHPSFVDAHLNAALCYLKQMNQDEAKYHLEQASCHDPLSPKILSQLGQLYLQEQALPQALIQFESLIDITPHDPYAHQSLGITYLQLKDDQKGLKHLEKAHQLKPDLDDINHNLACVYLLQRLYQKALKHWLHHYEIQPGPETAYNIGVTYLYLGRYNESCDYFFSVLAINPKHHAALINLGACYLQQNKLDRAREYYQRAQGIKPTETAAYVLASLSPNQTAVTPKQSPSAYVSDLFDHYAYHYDHHLCKILQYQVPTIIKKLIETEINPSDHSLNLLDLGCGTGLTAQALTAVAKTITGIDISQNMLDHAAQKNIYHQLIKGNLPDILDQQPKTAYHGVIAADLCPYFGDLEALFSSIKKQLHPNGWFIFTIEITHSQTNYHLQTSARYAHHPDYIQKLVLQQMWHIACLERCKLRTQQNQFIEGKVYLIKLQSNTQS